MIDVRVVREPLSKAVDMHKLPQGVTLAGIVDQVSRLPHNQVILQRDGLQWEVSPEHWARVRPMPGTTVIVAPHIGAAAIVPFVASSLGVSTLTASIIVAGVAVGVSLLAHQLFAPADPDPSSRTQDKQNPTINGLQNVFATIGTPVPMVLGRHRMAGVKTATGYSELDGQTVYRHERMTFGLSQVALSELKIGSTPITQFKDVEIQFRGVDETRTRAAIPDLATVDATFLGDTDKMTLYSRDVFEDAERVRLDYNDPVERDTPADTKIARVLYSFDGLVAFDDQNEKKSVSRRIAVYYRAAGSSDPWVTAKDKTYTRRTTATVRFSTRIKFPSAGAWSIKIVRLSPDSDDTQVRDDSYLDAIQSIAPGALPSVDGVAEIALRIKATDQISGALDPVNAVVQQLAPVWNGSAFSDPAPVRHPADIVTHLLRGPMRKKPVVDAKLALDVLRAWKLAWPQWTFDAVVTDDIQLGALIDQVLSVGLAMRDVQDAKHAVLTDQSKEPPVQMFTPRNTANYGSALTKPPEIHGLRVRFTSERAGWQGDEVICYANGYSAANATEIETVEPRGLVLDEGGSVTKIAQYAYYHLAQLLNRQTEVTFDADLEHVLCGRGDPVVFASDALRNTYGVGEILSFTSDDTGPTSIALDNTDMQLTAGTQAHLMWRTSAGAMQYVTATFTGDDWTVSPGTGVRPGGTFDPDDIASGDLATAYEIGTEVDKWLVKEIVPELDGTARVTLTEATEVPLDDLTRPLPEYDPSVIVTNEPTGLSGAIEYDGARMFVVLRWTALELGYQDRFRVVLTDDQANVVGQIDTADTFARFEVQPVFAQTFTGTVTLVPDWGLPSVPKSIAVSTANQFTAPDTPADFQVRVVGEVLYLTWGVAAINIDYHEIRYSPETSGATWAASVPVLPRARGDQAQVPARNGSYLIKAVSYQGKQSATAAMVVVNSAGARPNAVETLTLAPDFTGTLGDGLTIDTGVLYFAPDPDLTTIYEVGDVVDLGAVDTSRLSVAIDALGYYSTFDIFDVEDIFAVDDLFGAADGLWTLTVQVSTTDDDPTGSPTWSDWTDLIVGDYRARAFRFRLLFEVIDPQVTVRVDEVTFTVDMTDRIINGADIAVGTGGQAITFSPPYRALTSLTVNPQGLPSGGTWEITGKTKAGFTITLKDSGGSAVSGTFDYQAIGYGREGV